MALATQWSHGTRSPDLINDAEHRAGHVSLLSSNDCRELLHVHENTRRARDIARGAVARAHAALSFVNCSNALFL